MSKLTDILFLLYSMDEADTARTARILNERMRASWINHLSSLAKAHGCSQLGKTPKGADAAKFKADSLRDAESITRTFNRELQAEIARIVKDVPTANRNTIAKRLATWKKLRDSHKIWSIGLNSDSGARQYAFSQFYLRNPDIARGWVAAGVPPTCKLCIRIFAAGIVDFAYTQTHPLGRDIHINCPHYYRAVAPVKTECSKLWVS